MLTAFLFHIYGPDDENDEKKMNVDKYFMNVFFILLNLFK